MKIDRSFFLPENQAPKKTPLFTYLAGIPEDQRNKEVQKLAEQNRIIEEDFLGDKLYYVREERV